MQRTMYVLGILTFFLIQVACSSDDDETPAPEPEVPAAPMDMEFAFEEDEEGWQGGFSDLPSIGHDIYSLAFDHRPLPETVGTASSALYIQGHNRSDDLFMFFKKEVKGFEANARYRVTFQVELASQYPLLSFGIGGSPGGSVYLKAGAVPFEPEAIVENNADQGYLQMNLDKGNQSTDGEHMYNLGNIGIDGEEFRYKLINRNNAERPLEVQASDEGVLWFIIGTDSGFEGLTELYYNKINISLEAL